MKKDDKMDRDKAKALCIKRMVGVKARSCRLINDCERNVNDVLTK